MMMNSDLIALHKHALCAGDPEPNELAADSNRFTNDELEIVARFAHRCYTCPVQRTCNDIANRRDDIGIWGGTIRGRDNHGRRLRQAAINLDALVDWLEPRIRQQTPVRELASAVPTSIIPIDPGRKRQVLADVHVFVALVELERRGVVFFTRGKAFGPDRPRTWMVAPVRATGVA